MESQHMYVRMRVAMSVGEAVENGEYTADQFEDNDVNQYMSDMSTSGKLTDMMFLVKLAQLLNTDIIIIHMHASVISEDQDNFSPCVIIRGGPNHTFAPNIPIFLGYFEECFFRVCILVLKEPSVSKQ